MAIRTSGLFSFPEEEKKQNNAPVYCCSSDKDLSICSKCTYARGEDIFSSISMNNLLLKTSVYIERLRIFRTTTKKPSINKIGK